MKFVLPHDLKELGLVGLTSIELAQSLGMTNARILNKLKGYSVQQKFIDDPNWKTKTIYKKTTKAKKSTHVVHMSLFTAKIILLSIRSPAAQDYLVCIFQWENMRQFTEKLTTQNKNLQDYPDWKEYFVH